MPGSISPTSSGVLCSSGVSREHFRRGPARVGDDDVHRAADRLRNPVRRISGREAFHAAAFRQQVRDEDDGSAHIGECFLHAAHEQRRQQAGEEAAGTNDHGVERANRGGNDGMNGHLRLEPDSPDFMPPGLTRIDFDFAPSACSVVVFDANRSALDTDRVDSCHGSPEARAVRPRPRGSRRCRFPSSRAAGFRPCARPARSCCSSVGSRDEQHVRASRSFRASASAHFRTSPGGNTPSSSRS